MRGQVDNASIAHSQAQAAAAELGFGTRSFQKHASCTTRLACQLSIVPLQDCNTFGGLLAWESSW